MKGQFRYESPEGIIKKPNTTKGGSKGFDISSESSFEAN